MSSNIMSYLVFGFLNKSLWIRQMSTIMFIVAVFNPALINLCCVDSAVIFQFMMSKYWVMYYKLISILYRKQSLYHELPELLHKSTNLHVFKTKNINYYVNSKKC